MAGTPPSSPKRRERAWARVAVLLAFGAGIVAGGVALMGVREGFDPMLGLIAGGALVLVLVSNLLATRRIEETEPDSPRLPGEKYADRDAPEPHKVSEGDLEGVPFSASKKVTKGHNGANKRIRVLNKKLEKVNKELQRANVKLGLGELSEDGYEKIVQRLKKRRAQLEDELNRHR